jgi:hypothetical protein
LQARHIHPGRVLAAQPERHSGRMWSNIVKLGGTLDLQWLRRPVRLKKLATPGCHRRSFRT